MLSFIYFYILYNNYKPIFIIILAPIIRWLTRPNLSFELIFLTDDMMDFVFWLSPCILFALISLLGIPSPLIYWWLTGMQNERSLFKQTKTKKNERKEITRKYGEIKSIDSFIPVSFWLVYSLKEKRIFFNPSWNFPVTV